MIDKKIQLAFNNTVNKRVKVRTNCELYSHDKNNNEFELTIGNHTLTNEDVIILFKFIKSVKYWETQGKIEDNKIKFKFDTSLITDNERVNCYIILKSETKESDVYSFSFDVKMSEYDLKDNLPVKERYFANSVVVDKLDVLTKEVLAEELEKAKSTYALKSDLSEFVRTSDISDVVRTATLNDYQLKSEMPNVVEIVNNTVDNKGFLTSHQSLVDYAKKSELPIDYVSNSKLEELKTQLTIDTSNFATKQELQAVSGRQLNVDNLVTKDELNSKNYLTAHQDISNLATKQELQEVSNRQVTVDTSDFATKEELRKAFLDEEEREKYAKKTELPQPYNDTDIKSRLTVLENKPSGSGSELRGHGVPTDTSVPIGTTYIDEDVTSGALKWIKTKEKWKVIEGDTGWVDVPVTRFESQSKMQVRRVNDIVHVRFSTFPNDGLIRISDYVTSRPPYLTIFTSGIVFGWKPTQKIIQPILPEITFSNSEYTYDSSQNPRPYLRLNPNFGGLDIELYIDEFTVTNTGLGVYINSFSYLTEDNWPSSLVIR